MFSKLFIDRPRFAVVISLVITIAGLIAMTNLPVAEMPDITPPVVHVSAIYPGANAETIAETVAAPIEQEINGVENMIYMESEISNDGSYDLSVTFKMDSNPDINQVNLQNRLQLAQSQLPQEVIDQGISVTRRSTDMLGVVSFISPDNSKDQLEIGNFVIRRIKDALVRVDGVSDTFIFGDREYSMRIWADPDRLTAFGLSPADVVSAVRKQNIQATVGYVGTAPASKEQEIQFTLRAKGRLTEVSEFENIIIRTNESGGVVRVKDVARVELGGKSYSIDARLNNNPSVAVAIYKSSEANALETMVKVREELKRLEQYMPAGIDYRVMYDSTDYIRTTINEIVFTLFLTFLLVIIVIYIFLQDLRATIIPSAAIPVSIIGTFAVMSALGYNINTISLFAFILAIGLVVDDAIVVVENVHRVMEEEDVSAKDAAIKAMKEVTGPIIATTLVLIAIFVPIAFMPGISGQLYKQFGVAICISVIFSSINSLTLSPALCAVFLKKPKVKKHGPFAWFNTYLSFSRNIYTSTTRWLLKKIAIPIVAFICVVVGVYFLSEYIPTSFLPNEDKGAFFVDIKLAEGATLEKTMETLSKVSEIALNTDGVADILAVSGFSLLSGSAENVGFCIIPLVDWDERPKGVTLETAMAEFSRKVNAEVPAQVFPFAPPPIMGLGTTGGFDFRLQAVAGQPAYELAQTASAFVAEANAHPAIGLAYTTYSAETPQLNLIFDRDKMRIMGIEIGDVFAVLQNYLGSQYINDFNLTERVYQVRMQADIPYRMSINDIKNIYVKNREGKMVPIENFTEISTILGPQIIKRYNMFPSVTINGEAAPGFSSGQAMLAMEQLAKEKLPDGYAYEWSSTSYQEKEASGTVVYIFLLAFIFGYLFLVAQYESWNIPLSVMLSIIVATLGAFIGLLLRGMSLSIYAQIGVVLLVALAAKNAILIVEFAELRRKDGMNALDASVDGAGTRFRPVLMTAFTFILGVFPLVIATGAGSNSRQEIGTTVFFGMLAATTIGLFFIPALYYVFQKLREKGTKWRKKTLGI
jgi:HAE1 family hydrophobic/amphiphilic exporter-1